MGEHYDRPPVLRGEGEAELGPDPLCCTADAAPRDHFSRAELRDLHDSGGVRRAEVELELGPLGRVSLDAVARPPRRDPLLRGDRVVDLVGWSNDLHSVPDIGHFDLLG